MVGFTRRQLLGLLATAAIAGCAQPQQADPPLPMGAPLPKAAKQDAPKVDVGDVPATFRVKFETTKGDFVIEVHRDWSPHGAARFYELVKTGFYDDCRFFRVLPGFMAQWGIHGDPSVMKNWRDANISDDRPSGENRQSNVRGMVTFAKSGRPNSRSTQIFANYANNSRLDADGFTPFGQVLSGMEVLERLNSKYGESASGEQGAIQEQGNAFLDQAFPGLDSIKKANFVDSESTSNAGKSDDNKLDETEKP
ncbi:hypothetical protein LBMAG52_38800 [Planctomycetia bacterium]|nr:hypothetical protein LBMAG52_38800 [Planctomycetia bacterium]